MGQGNDHAFNRSADLGVSSAPAVANAEAGTGMPADLRMRSFNEVRAMTERPIPWTTYFFIYLTGFVTYPLLVMINVWRIWL
jgi:hypothetical protein